MSIATETLPRSATKTDTGLSSSSHSSTSTTSSAEFYDLNEKDARPVLVYNHLSRDRPLYTSSQQELCLMLDKDENLRVTKKDMPPDRSELEVRQKDLFLEHEHNLYKTKPTYIAWIATVPVPGRIFWPRYLASLPTFSGFFRLAGAKYDSYDQLYIVSQEFLPRSPPSSQDSGSFSRDNAWGQDSEWSIPSDHRSYE